MYRYVLVCTGTYRYILFCPILYRCIGFQMSKPAVRLSQSSESTVGVRRPSQPSEPVVGAARPRQPSESALRVICRSQPSESVVWVRCACPPFESVIRVSCSAQPIGGSPADLLTNQAVLNQKVHGHTSRAPPVGIKPATPQLQAFAKPTSAADTLQSTSTTNDKTSRAQTTETLEYCLS